MQIEMDESPRTRNYLLAALPYDEYARFAPLFEHVHAVHGETVARAGQRIDYAYFPLTGMISVVALMSEGLGVEVATVGNEGMIGLPVLFGGDTTPFDVMWQIEGEALRIRVNDLLTSVVERGPLASVLMRYSLAFLFQTAQNGACNAVHTVSQRCARWLLSTRDRTDGDSFFLTHEFLAFMLGITRQSTSLAVADFARRGIIAYQHGHMQIVDRASLEVASCECYRSIRAEFERLLEVGRGRARPASG